MVSSLPRQREEVSEEDLRIMHEATGPLPTFKMGKASELRAGKLCTARAIKKLSVALKILRVCSQTGLTLREYLHNSILLQFLSRYEYSCLKEGEKLCFYCESA